MSGFWKLGRGLVACKVFQCCGGQGHRRSLRRHMFYSRGSGRYVSSGFLPPLEYLQRVSFWRSDREKKTNPRCKDARQLVSVAASGCS